jgi:hypothetical protein
VKSAGTPRHWLWTCCSVVIIVGLLLASVVYFFGYDAAKSWVESPSGQKTASSGLSKVIKVYGKFAPLHLDGWTIKTDSFTSKGWPGEAIGGLNTYGVVGELDPAAMIWRHVYHIKGIQVDHADITLLQPNDALKLKMPPKKPKPWYAYLLPSAFVCGPIVCPKAQLEFEFQKQIAHIRDAHVQADLIGKDFQYTATSGTLEFPYLPPLHIEKMVMLVTRPMVTVSEARLTAVDPTDPARLTLSGVIGMRENKEVDAHVDVVDMPIEQIMPEDLAPLIHGRASGKLVWKRNQNGDVITSDGELNLSGAGIRDLSVFKQLELLHGNPDLENFDFQELTCKFHRENGVFNAVIVANSDGKFSLTGTISYVFDTKVATLDLAFKDLPLKTWMPTEFKPRYSGMASATLKWSGNLKSIKDSNGAVSLNLDGTQITDPVLLRKFLQAKGLRSPDEINFKTAQLDFSYQDQVFQLTRCQLDAPGFITINGKGTLTSPDNTLDADMTWQGVILQDWLSEKLAQDFSGTINGGVKFHVQQWKLKDGSYAGDIQMVDGQLHYTSVQSMFARFVNDPKLLKIPLRRALFSWTWNSDGLAVNGIDIRGGDDFGVQGSLAMNKAGELCGTLQVGLRPVYLKSFMGLADPVFKREDDGLRWARVQVSGTSKKPKQDLSTQLLAQLRKHPLALIGMSGKMVSWYVGNLFGAEEDWMRPVAH